MVDRQEVYREETFTLYNKLKEKYFGQLELNFEGVTQLKLDFKNE